jgi:hypothetical protein
MAAGTVVFFFVLLVVFCGAMSQCERCLKDCWFSGDLTRHLKRTRFSGACVLQDDIQQMQDLAGAVPGNAEAGHDGGRESDADGAGECVDAWGSPAEWDPNGPRERWHMGSFYSQEFAGQCAAASFTPFLDWNTMPNDIMQVPDSERP